MAALHDKDENTRSGRFAIYWGKVCSSVFVFRPRIIRVKILFAHVRVEFFRHIYFQFIRFESKMLLKRTSA